MSNLKFCEEHQQTYLLGDGCSICKSSPRPLRLPDLTARTLARYMNMEPRFDMAASATFYFYGVKIVVTKEDRPDQDPDGIDAHEWNNPFGENENENHD